MRKNSTLGSNYTLKSSKVGRLLFKKLLHEKWMYCRKKDTSLVKI